MEGDSRRMWLWWPIHGRLEGGRRGPSVWARRGYCRIVCSRCLELGALVVSLGSRYLGQEVWERKDGRLRMCVWGRRWVEALGTVRRLSFLLAPMSVCRM